MKGILGSQFETSLRVLLLLSASHEKPLKEETIAKLDFITVYSRDFGVTDSNLHGESKYRFGEFASRHELVYFSLKKLVLDGMINVSQSMDDFEYLLSDIGLEFVLNLNSEYAETYYETATEVLIKTRNMSEEEISKMINRCSIASIRR